MKKFIKICKAILPRYFRVAYSHLSFCWLQTAYFPVCVSLESHAIKHYICVYGLPKLHLHLSTCSFSTDCALEYIWFDAACCILLACLRKIALCAIKAESISHYDFYNYR